MEEPAFDRMSAELQSALLEVLPHLRAFARSLTRNRDQADDLVNDAIVRAISASAQFTPGTNFKAWIFTILRNLFYNEGRKRHSKFTSLDDLTINEPSINASQEASLEFCDFRRAFWQLNADQREVLILVGASGLSYEEAGVARPRRPEAHARRRHAGERPLRYRAGQWRRAGRSVGAGRGRPDAEAR